ncbi:MAG: hypothetical protein E7272_05800 [Pseudobutyrivibrio ruminis]|uniref:Uncharacterized protein n=1 Tax=Pseudobutyrivibrio ruminis TaxID=46206 RepID=A0A927U6U4_9FIRM|nr:hypothetical protein [Pseudobutyrivibrio sp.]MBE5919344.1 hypothetical protein [Pseudobutyrivibrio ruminis]MBQ6463579.1 hypothetical protein [Pseudobutyrivibrio sp.]
MMYQYMVLDDETAIAHSEMKSDGKVKVYIEKPVEEGFYHATCWLPDYHWSDCVGFSDEDMERLKKFVENNAHIIIELSQEGGFDNASGF